MKSDKSLSKFLKDKRLEAGLTVVELARLANEINPGTVLDGELGQGALSHDCIAKLIEVLDVGKEEIVRAAVTDVQAAFARIRRP